jgi:predicted RNA-binding Zn-ribbon protein involved in translation (DUF1610 family)
MTLPENFLPVMIVAVVAVVAHYIVKYSLCERCPSCGEYITRSDAKARTESNRQHKYKHERIYRSYTDKNGSRKEQFSGTNTVPYYQVDVEYKMKCKHCGNEWTVSRQEWER